MLFLLGAGNSVASVVASVSSDFKRSKSTIYRDLRNMDIWGEEFFEIEFNPLVSAGKLSILFRDTMDVALSSKHEKDKHQARAAALAIVKVQIDLGNRFGARGRQAQEVSQTTSVRLPFEANPDIMAAYRSSAEKQKAEKEAQAKSNLKSEGKNEEDIKREPDGKPVA